MVLTYAQKQQLLKDLLSDQSLDENQIPAEGMLSSLLNPVQATPAPDMQLVSMGRMEPSLSQYEEMGYARGRPALKEAPQWQPPSPPPEQEPNPQNYIKNDRTGVVTNLDQFANQQPQGPQANMARPVDYMGQKGFWSDDGRIILNNGKIVSIQDEGTNARDLARRKVEAEIDYRLSETEKNRRGEAPKAPEGYRWTATGGLEDIPGGPVAMKKSEAAAKAAEEKKGSEKYLVDRMGDIEGALSDLLGVPKDKLAQTLSAENTANVQSKIAPATGAIQGNLPYATSPEWNKVSSIRSNISRLKSLAQTGGLAELRKSGISPGSVTEREWPKFEAALANLDLSLPEPELAKQLADIYSKVTNVRGELGDSSPAMGARIVTSEAEAEALPRGTIFTLNGRRGIKD